MPGSARPPGEFMRLALAEAERALGWSSPNPAVGAVIVLDGAVVGAGHTQPPGGPHAEVMALREAGTRARGATAYVTLEPHAHRGRTPPARTPSSRRASRRSHYSLDDPTPR
ncbi:MAG: hypothetical protein U0360_10325 [Dehalococcoidia bacterium]